MSTTPTISPELIDELVQRIVSAVHPIRIVLFGSAVRGQFGPESDLDLLVIVASGSHRRKTAQDIYRCLRGLGVAKDVIVATESDIAEHSHNPSLVLYPALREGRELYRAER